MRCVPTGCDTTRDDSTRFGRPRLHPARGGSTGAHRGGRAQGGTGTEIATFLLLIVAIVGGAIAFEEIDHWSQWVVLGGIVATVIGFMIAVSPNRRGA